jgi:hypothetical protein
MLTERKAELLSLEAKLERRIRRSQALFWLALAISNLASVATAVVIALHLARAIWRLS